MKYLLSFATILLLLGCGKVKEQLPPETSSGEFTFGCKVDGKIYKVHGRDGLLAMEFVDYYIYPPDSTIHITVINSYTEKDFRFYFDIHYTGSNGIYQLKSYPYRNRANIQIGRENYSTSFEHTGWVNIKNFNGQLGTPLSPSNLSGTFEMEAVNDKGKVVHITEGRFDIGP